MTAARLHKALLARSERYLARPIRRLTQLASRRQRIAQYLTANTMPALILGAGPQRRPGWLATDLQPDNSDVIYVDATKPLPFADGSFAFIFAEHMMEHVPHEAGVRLAGEAVRVLRPGGVFRIATPDLQAIARLALPPLDAAAQQYVQSSNKLFGSPHHGPAFAVNRAFYWWGHQFLYDEATLRQLLLQAGFAGVMRQEVGQSEHGPLRNLENHGDVIGAEMNAYETMVLEATKAGQAR